MDARDIIIVDDVSVCFNLSKDKVDSIKEYLIRFTKKQLFYDEFWALQNISFNVKRGEILGLIGLNGAGKSTLLKLIAGVIKPTKGLITVKGSIAPLIELGAGFDPDLTARENVFMNGAVLGYDTTYMRQHYQEIMDFSELWSFENVPVKNFSSGMYARLGFAIATSVSADILIIDEILGVGDYKFQEKCAQRINELMANGTTVIMVSHDGDTIRQYCERVVWLEKGCMKAIGECQKLCDEYYQN